MSRGLTQEQKDFLDKEMKDYRKRTGTALSSVNRMDGERYVQVEQMNFFETIYQEVNMYLWDNKDRRYDLHKRYYKKV